MTVSANQPPPFGTAGTGPDSPGEPAAPARPARIRRSVWLLLLLLALVLVSRYGTGVMSSLFSPGNETLADYLRTLPGDGAQQSCRAERCSIATVQGRPAGAQAVRITAQVLPLKSRLLDLPASFNRSALLSEDSRQHARSWGAPGPNPGVGIGNHEWRLQYMWWAGGQRFDSIRLPEPGYVRALVPRDGGAPVPIGHFSADGLGFRLRDLTQDGPAPYDFSQAVFQPVPDTLSVRIERQQIAGLVPGDLVTLADDIVERGELRTFRIGATVAAMQAVDGLPDRMDVQLEMDPASRNLWQWVCIQHEALHRSISMPATVQIAAARVGGARDGQFVWLPSGAVQPRTRADGAAAAARHQVWVIFGEFTAPVAVVLGARQAAESAVLEIASPGLEAAIDHADWAALSPPQRREVIRQLGGNNRNLHLYPGMPVIANPTSDLRPGMPVRSAQRS